MHYKRPTDRELFKRIKEAKQFLKDNPGLFANASKVVGELNNLNIGNTNEVWTLILEFLEELSPKDYRGTRPPQRSYEKLIAGIELLAFSWWSPKMGKEMYIKFALKKERYYYISLHESRFIKEQLEED